MWAEIARIVHVTDMHLFVDHNGIGRPVHEKARLLRAIAWLANQPWAWNWIQSLEPGLHEHSREALSALTTTIKNIIAKCPCPVALIQSGDLEAYGGLELPGQAFPINWAFPAFDYWLTECRNLGPQVQVSIYGNHDVWPNTLPWLRLPVIPPLVEASIRRRPEFSGVLPDLAGVITTGAFSLEVYRLNTAVSNVWPNAIAGGYISADSSSQGNSAAAMLQYQTNSTKTSGKLSIRMIVMHHPAHFFNATGTVSDLTEGVIRNLAELTAVLNAQRFHFILAGHRHDINPAPGVTLAAHSRSQPPVPAGTIQLVAGSSTQICPAGSTRRPSFSVYSIRGDDQQGLVTLDRTVYRFLNDINTEFTPDPTETLVGNLPL